MTNEPNQGLKREEYTAPLDKITPKFCTKFQVTVLETGEVVLTMLYSEGNDINTLIDRVVINKKHAAKLGAILIEASNKAGEDKDAE